MVYGNRRKHFRILNSPLALVLSLCLFVLLTKAAWGIYSASEASANRLEQVQKALGALQSRQNDLTTKVEYLRTDSGLESEIRTKFRAAQTDEQVAVIVGENENKSITSTTTIEQGKEKSSWFANLLKSVGL